MAAVCVEEIVRADWLDLGMPEALWSCRVREFGPLIVSIDSEGNNLIDENKKLFNERKEPIIKEISAKVDFLD